MKIDVDEFIEICIDTLTMVPIHKTAARLNRHKFLSMLEKYLESEKIQLSGTIECDVTYVLESSKGSSLKHRKARHRGEPSRFRGISHEQICIVTTTDCYNSLAECKNCKVVHLKGHQSYNQVEHLNVVNHIHSVIKNKLASLY